jgi:hypothetical protein
MLLDAVAGQPHRGTVEMPTRLVVRSPTEETPPVPTNGAFVGT